MWPRLDYVLDARLIQSTEDIVPERGVLIVCGGKTVSVVQPYSMENGIDGTSILNLLRLTRKQTPGSEETDGDEVYTFERVMMDEEIKEMWMRNGTLASHTGTEAHYMCELFLNGLPCRWWEPEMQILFSFIREHMLPRNIIIWNTEKEIVCRDADIGGSIDAILYDADANVHHILDFKRSDKLAGDMHNAWGGRGSKMESPMSHLDDCRGASYSLQLGIYQFILERDYGFNIGDRILLSIHPDKPFMSSVPYLRAEVDYIMRKQFALVLARKAAMQTNPEKFTCCFTNAPANEAVRLTDGRIAMEKAAILRQVDYEPAVSVRTEFAAKVKELMSDVSPPATEECILWKRRISKEGAVPFV
jgi:hypothetical protein